MHKGHRERLRQKFIKSPESLEKHEILELLLTFGIPRANTNTIAHNLFDKFGSFSGIFDASIKALISVKGIGLLSAVLIKVISIIIRLYMEDKNNPTNKTVTKEQVGQMFFNKYIGRNEECIAITLLDSKMHILYCDIVCNGNFNKVDVNMREIIHLVLNYHAKYVIIAHNHPSGLALPSKDDIETTKSIKNALKMIDVTLLDHFILSDNDYVSLAESDLKDICFK